MVTQLQSLGLSEIGILKKSSMEVYCEGRRWLFFFFRTIVLGQGLKPEGGSNAT